VLKGIDPLLGPELLAALARMGHGDEIAVVDRNYPAYSAGPPVIRADGVDTVRAVRGICSVLPLDTFVERPFAYMHDGRDEPHPVTLDVLAVVRRAEGRDVGTEGLAREAFYRRARSAAVVLTTGESRPYGCFVLTKGVWPQLEPAPSSDAA